MRLIALIGAIGTAVAVATNSADLEVRVTARGTESGSVEFAIQQRMPDGTWSERITGRGRFMTPALIAEQQWKNATSVTVSVPLPEPATATATPTATPTATATPERTPAPLSDAWFELSSGSYVSPLSGDPAIFLHCLSLDLGTRVLPSVSVHYDRTSFATSRSVSYRIDGGSVVTESWSNTYLSGGTSAVYPSDHFIDDLRYASSITIQIGVSVGTLDVGGAGTLMDRLGCF